MELRQHLIHRNFDKAEAKNQISIGDDYSIPEGKPDIAGILLKKAEMAVEEVYTEKGKVRVRGTMKVQILYVPERSEETLANLGLEIPFDEVLYMEGAVSGDHLKIDWNIEDLRITIIHPGKISVRAVVLLSGRIAGMENHAITENISEEEDVCTSTGSFVYAEPVILKKDSYRIKDEVILPANKPNVKSVLWQDLQVRGLDLQMRDGKLAVKGEMLFFVLYEGEEESGTVQWMEQTVPFHGHLEVPGLSPEMFGNLETEIARQSMELKPDYDGELRMFQLEILLDISMEVSEEQSCAVLKDAYGIRKQLCMDCQKISYHKLRMCNDVKCKVSGEQAEDGEKILQILGHQAQLLGRKEKLTDQGILLEGTLEVRVLFITADDRQPFQCRNLLIPYKQLIEIPEMDPSDCWKVTERLEQIFLGVPESDRIEVKGLINLSVCVFETREMENVVQITEEPYDPEEYQKQPAVKIHFVQPKETLWEIAKENRASVESIQKLNELQTEEVLPGQKLLLKKTSLEKNIL